MLLLCGGYDDPEVMALARRLFERRIAAMSVLINPGLPARITWDIAADRLTVDGQVCRPTGLFLGTGSRRAKPGVCPPNQRHDAALHRARNWQQTFLSWVLAHEEVAFPNRACASGQPAAPYVLALARRFGLAVPETLVTDDVAGLDHHVGDAPADGMTKPVWDTHIWGAPDWSVHDRNRPASGPVLLQRRIDGPHLRVFRIVGHTLGFEITTSGIRTMTPPQHVMGPLDAVMTTLGLEFGAADFRKSPVTSEYLFLGLDTAPAFSVFDSIVGGRLCDAVIEALRTLASSPSRTPGRITGRRKRKAEAPRSFVPDAVCRLRDDQKPTGDGDHAGLL